MQKEFFPDIEFNRKRRTKLVTFYVLLAFLPGGFAVWLFTTGNSMMGILMAGMLVLLVTMIPSSLAQYPIKRKPLITFEGKSVKFGANEYVKVADILAVSICIEVPQVSKVNQENRDFLLQVASTKPTEPVLGACDVTIRNEKGKEVIKYAIIEDCIGALEEFLEIGVKKYRILYSQKKLTEEAKYKMVAPNGASQQLTLEDLSEKEKMDQLY